MRYAYNSIATGVFIGISLLFFKKRNLRIEKALLVPILLYLLMVASLCWSTDFTESKAALFKMFPLLLIPFCFLINPSFTGFQYRKLLDYYGSFYVFYALFYLGRALIRFALTKDASVFFYHGLVTQDVNAIHVSVYMGVAFFSLLTKSSKTIFNKLGLGVLAAFIILLSSKNVIVVFLLLIAGYLFFFGKFKNKKQVVWLALGFGLLFSVVFFQKIKSRFEIEISSNVNQNTVNKEISTSQGLVYNVSVGEAWNAEKFNKNDFFPGTALRVYQLRIFLEMMKQESAYITGFGLNATKHKIKEKRIEHNLYEGYDEFNFHNQYVQFFAEIGVFGFLLLLLMVFWNLKNAIKNKDFTHISFAILMISLFLTESFLSRQRGIAFFIVFYSLFNVLKTVPVNEKN